MLCVLLFFAFLAQKIEDKDWSANQGCKDRVGKTFLRYIAGKEQIVQKKGDCQTKRSVKDTPEVFQLGNKQGYDRVDCISALSVSRQKEMCENADKSGGTSGSMALMNLPV